ncbi:MAG TPA: hypothetical protein VM243_02000 [Phycisphaerae bacterium]|nr:hypothetical protein [Phycisphaerae bacterium]
MTARVVPSKTAGAPVACIDLDCFCEGCGYNLRTLAVHREPSTGIPVVRCPECGRFQAANNASTALRPWLRRLTSLLLAGWILGVVAGFFLLGMAEVGISQVMLDELTISGGTRVQRIGNTTIQTWVRTGPLQPDTDYEDYNLVVTSILACSFGIAFACGLCAVVVCPHWRRVAHVGLMLGMPLAAGGVVALYWSQQAPHLFVWGVPYMASHASVQLLGGLAGVNFGRPLARLVVRVILPPAIRPSLAFLWLADDKPFPRPSGR